MPTYFISHASADRPFIEKDLIDLLGLFDIEYWYSKKNIKTGKQWERSIKSGLESCDGLVLVMSQESASSEWVKDEVSWAMANRPGHVIPILYKDCELDAFHIRIPRIQYADFSSDEKEGRNKLISLLRNVEHEAKSRAGAIRGAWEGAVSQLFGPDKQLIKYPIRLELEIVEQGEIKGSVTITHPEVGELDFKIMGGFLYERFVQFSYHSQDSGAIQFGAAILELDPTGDVMGGKFVGYGAFSRSIVTGDLAFSKTE